MINECNQLQKKKKEKKKKTIYIGIQLLPIPDGKTALLTDPTNLGEKRSKGPDNGTEIGEIVRRLRQPLKFTVHLPQSGIGQPHACFLTLLSLAETLWW
jgi:hypothetical protein